MHDIFATGRQATNNQSINPLVQPPFYRFPGGLNSTVADPPFFFLQSMHLNGDIQLKPPFILDRDHTV